MAVSQRIHCPATNQIQIFFSIGIPHPTPFPAHNDHRLAPHDRDIVLFFEGDPFAAFAHYYASLLSHQIKKGCEFTRSPSKAGSYGRGICPRPPREICAYTPPPDSTGKGRRRRRNTHPSTRVDSPRETLLVIRAIHLYSILFMAVKLGR